MWNERVVKRIEKCRGAGGFTIACSFKNVDNNFVWAFVGVLWA
jgi:hypothetical protein